MPAAIIPVSNNVTTSSYTLGDAPNYLAWPGGGTRGTKVPSTDVDGITLGQRAPSYPFPGGATSRRLRVFWAELEMPAAAAAPRRLRVYWTEVEVP